MKKTLLLFTAITFLILQHSAAQSTYLRVYDIFQAKCIECHNSTLDSGQLDLSGTPAATYTALVNQSPANAGALSKGHKLIAAGDPHRSFLLRKINNGLDADNGISTPSEGSPMPNAPKLPLSDYEIELVRQWVMAGAPQSGTVVDTALIYEYYTVGGINSVPTALAPPAPGTGFQVHLGRLFVPKGTEQEFFLKYDPKLPATTEVIKLELAQSPQSHHFVIYKFFPGQSAGFPNGLRGTDLASHGSADAVSAFAPQQTNHELPPGTAYFLEQSAVFDLNLHIVNTSQDSVLAAEIYFNMYTQPQGTAQKYMFRRNFPELGIVLPPGDTSVYTQIGYDSSETNMWQIWIMYTHTHRYGIDYDVWKRNTDGTQGEQIYEGWYDWTYSFNQGYYGWGIHAPQKHFENPFLEINPHEGLIHKATWYNFGTDTMYFGLTSVDEMMVMGFEFTYGDPIPAAGIDNGKKANTGIVYPNPCDGKNIQLSFGNELQLTGQKLRVTLYDVLGRVVISKDIIPEGGKCTLTLSDSRLEPGIYFLSGNSNGISLSETIIVR